MFRFWDNFKVIRASSDPGARIPRTNYRWSNVTWNIQCRSNVVCYFISRIFMYFSSVDLSFDVLCYPSNIKRIFQTQLESPSLREPPKSFSHLEMSHPFSTIPKMAFLFLFLSFVSNVFESLIGERLGRTSGIGFHNKHHKSRIMEDLGGSWRILDSAKKKERWRGRGRGARCWNKPIKQTWNKARNVLLSASTAAIVVVVICAVERTGSPRFGNGEITTRKKKTHQDVYLRIALAFVEEEMLQRRSSPQTPNILRPLFPIR